MKCVTKGLASKKPGNVISAAEIRGIWTSIILLMIYSENSLNLAEVGSQDSKLEVEIIFPLGAGGQWRDGQSEGDISWQSERSH